MPDILHRVGVNAPAQKVYDALATTDGLRSWWIDVTKGDTKVGGTIDFGFCKMKVLESVPGKLVHWKCIEGPPEWVGTEVIYKLDWKDKQTFILFKHANWKEPVEFMHHCSTKWATFLLSLRDELESGKGRPQPRDVKIHVGD
jgi:uncharacterized protein YndB with AHSA1/START domain